jgi:predicted phage tail protein
MLKTIKLYGHLGRQFGKIHTLSVANPLETVRALSALYPGFEKALVCHSQGYRIVLDNAPLMSRDELMLPGQMQIKIIPVISGAGTGVGQLFMGVALMVGAIYAPEFLPGFGASAGVTTAIGNMAFAFGATLILGGLAQMLAKNPNTKPNDTASYLFNGPVNTTTQGNPVPILYGRLIIGSQVVSASVQAYDLPIAPNPTASPNQVTYKGLL